MLKAKIKAEYAGELVDEIKKAFDIDFKIIDCGDYVGLINRKELIDCGDYVGIIKRKEPDEISCFIVERIELFIDAYILGFNAKLNAIQGIFEAGNKIINNS